MLAGTEPSPQALNKLLSFRRHGRNPSIRRIHDQRSLAVRLLTLLPIRGRIDGDRLAILGKDFIVGLLLALRLLLSLREFLVGQKSSCPKVNGPLHRDVRNSRPLTLQVWIAPWCLGRCPCFCCRCGRWRGLLSLRGQRHRWCKKDKYCKECSCHCRNSAGISGFDPPTNNRRPSLKVTLLPFARLEPFFAR